MNEQTNPTAHLLLFRGNVWQKGLSPEQMQQIAGQWRAWFDRLNAAGKVMAGNPLENSGKLVSGKNGKVVADGPFAESKEAIGGYFLLNVKTMEEALSIAKDCPGLSHGCTVEVRPVAAVCPCGETANHEAELAAAHA
jgi:hypothetical protein